LLDRQLRREKPLKTGHYFNHFVLPLYLCARMTRNCVHDALRYGIGCHSNAVCARRRERVEAASYIPRSAFRIFPRC
jgi:hypothetical protein